MVIKYKKKLRDTQVIVLLKNFNRGMKIKSCNLHIPDLIFVPCISSPRELELRGLPYIMICDEFIEAYAGIFTPVVIVYSTLKKDGQNVIVVSDDAWLILEYVNSLRMTPENLTVFMEFGLVLGDYTLIDGIKIVEAGKKLIIGTNLFEHIIAFKYGNDESRVVEEPNPSIKPADFYDRFFEVVTEVFKEYVALLRNKTVVVPLSAGIDSRFVLAVLYLLGMRDVITVTYGPKNSEYPVAKKIAERLGYENIFVEYNYNSWRKILTEDLVNNLAEFSQLFRTPNIQEYVLTREIYKLCEENILNCRRSIVFVTGDISNALAGKLEPAGIHNYIDIFNYLSLFESPYPEGITYILKRVFHELISECKVIYGQSCDSQRIFEIIEHRERQFKYISSMRLPYKIYGFQFLAPLWDPRIVSYLLKIPWSLKYRYKLYENFLVNKFFVPLEINFKDPTKVSLMPVLVKHVIKTLIPDKPGIFTKGYSIPRAKLGRVSTRKGIRLNPLNFHVFFPLINIFVRKLEHKTHLFLDHSKVIRAYTKSRTVKNVVAHMTVATIYSIMPRLMQLHAGDVREPFISYGD